MAVFVGQFWSLLSQFLCLFLLVSPPFLLFHDILEHQNSPPNEVTGKNQYLKHVSTQQDVFRHVMRSDPYPDPSQHLKTRQKPSETDRTRPETDRNGPKTDIFQPLGAGSVGLGGGGGVVREKGKRKSVVSTQNA